MTPPAEVAANIVLGCLISGAIGDAMGARFENGSAVLALDEAEPWRVTDDTQLTLATCEAICSAARVDPSRIAIEFRSWLEARRLTGLGASTLGALRFISAGGHWATSGLTGERAAGNGAAMRIAPLAFFCNPAVSVDRGLIRDVCRITHRNEEAYAGGLAVVAAIRACLRRRPVLPPRDLLARVAEQLPDTCVRDRVALLATLDPLTPLKEIAKQYGCSGWVVESVPLALFASLRATFQPLQELLEDVIRVGGDTDTNASITGQIAGACIGIEAVPRSLVSRITGAREITMMFDRFAHYAERLG